MPEWTVAAAQLFRIGGFSLSSKQCVVWEKRKEVCICMTFEYFKPQRESSLLPRSSCSPLPLPSTARSQAALLVLLFGEDVASENFYFSLRSGGNLSNLSGIDGTKNAPGLNFGLMASIRLSERFYLVPEFMPLSPKGAKNIPFRPTGNASLDLLMQPATSSAMQMNYIDIPVVAKYYATKELGLEVGPQISILTGATDVYRGKIKEDDDLTYENNVKSSLNTIDMGVVVGLTYSLWDARGGKGLFVHARYAYGLVDIVKDNPGDAVKNSVMQFAVSFPFIIPPEQQEGAQ
jgi:hypothetical protein